MTANIDTLYRALMDNDELRRLIAVVPSITLVEYRCEGADRGRLRGSKAFARVLKDLGCSPELVTTLFLYGQRRADMERATAMEKRLFKTARIEPVCQDWKNVRGDKPLAHEGALIVHLTTETGYGEYDFMHSKTWNDFVTASRVVYCAAVWADDSLFGVSVRLQDSLLDFELPAATPVAPTDYCRERQKALQGYQTTLCNTEAYSRMVQEAQNGCTECGLSRQYGAKHICPIAQQQIAVLFREGTHAPKSDRLAHQWEVKAARQHYLPAMRQVAHDYRHGVGCAEDKAKAIAAYKECVSEFADQESCERIVELYREGGERQAVLALPWMARLAQAGNANYAKVLAEAYKEGKYGVPQSVSRFARMQAIAAKAIDTEDDLRAYIRDETPARQKDYGDDFLFGWNGFVKNPTFARVCYVESAQRGCVPAQERLTKAYYNGWFGQKDYKEAVRWGDMALANGSKEVRFEVAYIYADDNGAVEPDYQKAFRLYSELAEEGNDAAMNNLGCMYDRGQVSDDVDYEKAFEWYLKAATLGDDVAMNNVANYYHDGNGCEQDYDKALEWYRRAADKGYAAAMRNMARCYRYGEGVPKSGDEMKHWYELAIEKEDEDAMLQLAYCYCKGELVEKNEAEAVRLHTRAAEKGNKVGQYRLGWMYEQGMGVEADQEKAIFWYRKAAAKGEELAINRLKALNVYYIDEQGEFTE